MYKIVTPDGKVVYTDKPPTAGQGSVQQLQRPPAGGGPTGVTAPVAVPITGARPGVGIIPGVAPAPPGEIMEGLLGSNEGKDARDCARTNMATLTLIKAAEEVMRTVSNIRNSRARGASSYENELLERQWKYYKSLGGAASSPEEVRPPENPCKEINTALQQKGAAMQAKYRECIASHPKEVKLSSLSKQLVMNRAYLGALEKVQAERRKNPKIEPENKGSGEWAAMFNADPVLMRAALAQQFQEYRSAGGPAVRLEDVSEIPNPCAPEVGPSPRMPPITDKRTLTLPRE